MKFSNLSRVTLVLFLFLVTTVVRAENKPKVVFEKTTIELGEMKINSKKSFEVNFVNKGKGKLVFTRVKTGCPCTTVDFPKEFIPKGGKGKLMVTFDSNNFQPGEVTKTITVLTNSKKATQNIVFHVKLI